MSKDKDEALSPAEYENFLTGVAEHLKNAKGRKQAYENFKNIEHISYYVLHPKEKKPSATKRETLRTALEKIWKEAVNGLIELDPKRYWDGEKK